MQNINISNNILEVYVDTMKKVLNLFQSLEEKLIETIKDSLRKYVIYQVALVRNMQYDIEKKASIMESINVNADIKSFIQKNTTNRLPPYKFEFIPYTPEIRNNQTVPKDILSNVKTFISNVFFSEQPEIEINSSETKTQNEIEIIVNSVLDGKSIPEEEKRIVRI